MILLWGRAGAQVPCLSTGHATGARWAVTAVTCCAVAVATTPTRRRCRSAATAATAGAAPWCAGAAGAAWRDTSANEEGNPRRHPPGTAGHPEPIPRDAPSEEEAVQEGWSLVESLRLRDFGMPSVPSKPDFRAGQRAALLQLVSGQPFVSSWEKPLIIPQAPFSRGNGGETLGCHCPFAGGF